MIGIMKILLNGYGRMGRMVEQALLTRGHSISARIDPYDKDADSQKLSKEAADNTDMVIEFSLPDAVIENANLYVEYGLSAIVGTTGWAESKKSIGDLVRSAGTGYVYGNNFSIGAHLFFALTEKAAKLINPLPEYDISLYEIHHNQKKDSPSGTALTTGEKILSVSNRKKVVNTQTLDRMIKPDELHIASIRGGSNPGCHTVVLDSAADSLEIKHSARNRSGFALGAVIAAEWLSGKKGFFNIEEIMKDILK
jgi:4-hydroxy-tetrahydrodipicolinate reductase